MVVRDFDWQRLWSKLVFEDDLLERFLQPFLLVSMMFGDEKRGATQVEPDVFVSYPKLTIWKTGWRLPGQEGFTGFYLLSCSGQRSSCFLSETARNGETWRPHGGHRDSQRRREAKPFAPKRSTKNKQKLLSALEHEFYDFPIVGMMIQSDELHHFSEG